MLEQLKALYEQLKSCPKCVARRKWLMDKIKALENKTPPENPSA